MMKSGFSFGMLAAFLERFDRMQTIFPGPEPDNFPANAFRQGARPERAPDPRSGRN